MPSTTTGQMPSTRRNLELKVRVADTALSEIRQLAMVAGDGPVQHLDQDDRYFTVPEGRLKLRMVSSSDAEPRAELIAYRRPDDHGSRWSAYRITQLPPGEVEPLVETLSLVLPLLVRVRKRRMVALHGATRIHVDVVDGLGPFVELETVVTSQNEQDAREEHQHVIEQLGLQASQVEPGSYSDLLLGQ